MPVAIIGFCIFWFFLLNFDSPSCVKTNQEPATSQEQSSNPEQTTSKEPASAKEQKNCTTTKE